MGPDLERARAEQRILYWKLVRSRQSRQMVNAKNKKAELRGRIATPVSASGPQVADRDEAWANVLSSPGPLQASGARRQGEAGARGTAGSRGGRRLPLAELPRRADRRRFVPVHAHLRRVRGPWHDIFVDGVDQT